MRKGAYLIHPPQIQKTHSQILFVHSHFGGGRRGRDEILPDRDSGSEIRVCDVR